MPEREGPNVLLRVLVPVLLLLVGGGGLAYLMVRGAGTPSASGPSATGMTPATQTTSPGTTNAGDTKKAVNAQPTAPTAVGNGSTSPAAAPTSTPTVTAPAGTIYHARAIPLTEYSAIGALPPAPSTAPTSAPTPATVTPSFRMQLEFSPIGAGVERLTLADHYTSVQREKHEVLQELLNVPNDPGFGLVAFAADAITINGVNVGLGIAKDRTTQTLWRERAPGTFEAIIEDQDNKEIARIVRVYDLKPGSYEFVLRQRVENLTTEPMSVVWKQWGPADQPLGTIRYGGDVRRARFGYLLPAASDATRSYVQGGATFLTPHQDILGTPKKDASWNNQGLFPIWEPKTLWPNSTSTSDNYDLVWAAMTSRYFVVAMHAPELELPGDAGKTRAKAFTLAHEVGRLAVPTDPNNTAKYASAARAPKGYAVMTLTSAPITIAPGGMTDVSVGVYAGPMSKKFIEQEPSALAAGLEKIVVYTFGGPCGFCTFQPIALFLRWFLGTLHDLVFRDWALAIMFLVVCVRFCLHPVTRFSQRKMLAFGKQMQVVGPKFKAVQDKYKDDPVKLREEMGRLMRDEKVNYAGAGLGCLPAFLQTPIWIALYAMIYFTFEFRHEPAFYGIVQAISSGKWSFLADLAEPDNFLNFHRVFGTSEHGIWVWGLSSLMGPIEGLNVLPIVLGVVFFIQQKYMQPPTAATMTPEQKQQQAMVKWMTVFMFPLFMYNAPAALSLYFMTNSTLAIIESKAIRSKFEREQKEREARIAAGLEKPVQKSARNEPAKTGFLARMAAEVERRQKEMEAKQKAAQKKRK
jgi:YidC/Oxa1 family membrane protein insertase